MASILVVDDEKLICEGMRKAIERLNLFETHVAHSGIQALHVMDAHPIDAMLLDISMPDMNGIELMRARAARDEKPFTIVISGYDEFEYAKQAITYGAVDYVLKPVDPDDVMAMGQRLYALIEARDRELTEASKMRALLGELMQKNEPADEAPQDAAERARRLIDEHFADRNLSVNALSAKLGYSPNYVGSTFKRAYGMSINDYLGQVRVREAKRLMDETGMMVYEVAFEVGFSDQHYFSRTFKKHEGMSPSKYKERR